MCPQDSHRQDGARCAFPFFLSFPPLFPPCCFCFYLCSNFEGTALIDRAGGELLSVGHRNDTDTFLFFLLPLLSYAECRIAITMPSTIYRRELEEIRERECHCVTSSSPPLFFLPSPNFQATSRYNREEKLQGRKCDRFKPRFPLSLPPPPPFSTLFKSISVSDVLQRAGCRRR